LEYDNEKIQDGYRIMSGYI